MKNELLEVAKSYIKENCNKGGKVKGSNLSENQENAIKSLKEKRKDGIIVYQTDKTSKFVTDTVENMAQKMQKHIHSDPKMGPKKVTQIESMLNSHTSRLIDIFKVGEFVGHKKRTKMNLITEKGPIPVLRGTSKDHKQAINPEVGPDLRPIMGAHKGPNVGLAQLGCHFLKAILKQAEDTSEVKSTEEMLCKMQMYNKNREKQILELKSKGANITSKKVVGSTDINSFYPSANPAKVALVCKLMWNKAQIDVKNVEIKKLSLYLAKEIENKKIEFSGLGAVIPTRN